MKRYLSPFRIFRAGSERIDDLEPLWKELHHHHAAIAPQLGPARSPDESWQRRKAFYVSWFKDPGTFILIAEKDHGAIGYAFVRLIEGSETWRTADKVAEIETLSVLPEFRGSGLGSAFMEAIYAELSKVGVQEISLAVVATNSDALRFYERHGFIQRIIHMWKPKSLIKNG
jgi:ribosomal protein S18 acetylase RimI-like enzyme